MAKAKGRVVDSAGARSQIPRKKAAVRVKRLPSASPPGTPPLQKRLQQEISIISDIATAIDTTAPIYEGQVPEETYSSSGCAVINESTLRSLQQEFASSGWMAVNKANELRGEDEKGEEEQQDEDESGDEDLDEDHDEDNKEDESATPNDASYQANPDIAEQSSLYELGGATEVARAHFTTHQLKQIVLYMKKNKSCNPTMAYKEFEQLLEDLDFTDPYLGTEVIMALKKKVTRKIQDLGRVMVQNGAITKELTKKKVTKVTFNSWTDLWLQRSWDGSIRQDGKMELRRGKPLVLKPVPLRVPRFHTASPAASKPAASQHKRSSKAKTSRLRVCPLTFEGRIGFVQNPVASAECDGLWLDSPEKLAVESLARETTYPEPPIFEPSAEYKKLLNFSKDNYTSPGPLYKEMFSCAQRSLHKDTQDEFSDTEELENDGPSEAFLRVVETNARLGFPRKEHQAPDFARWLKNVASKAFARHTTQAGTRLFSQKHFPPRSTSNGSTDLPRPAIMNPADFECNFTGQPNVSSRVVVTSNQASTFKDYGSYEEQNYLQPVDFGDCLEDDEDDEGMEGEGMLAAGDEVFGIDETGSEDEEVVEEEEDVEEIECSDEEVAEVDVEGRENGYAFPDMEDPFVDAPEELSLSKTGKSPTSKLALLHVIKKLTSNEDRGHELSADYLYANSNRLHEGQANENLRSNLSFTDRIPEDMEDIESIKLGDEDTETSGSDSEDEQELSDGENVEHLSRGAKEASEHGAEVIQTQHTPPTSRRQLNWNITYSRSKTEGQTEPTTPTRTTKNAPAAKKIKTESQKFQPIYQVIDITFDTYPKWKEQLFMILKAQAAWSIIDGSISRPMPPDLTAHSEILAQMTAHRWYIQDVKAYEEKSEVAMGWMLLTMGERMRKAAKSYADPKALYEVLEREFTIAEEFEEELEEE